MPAIFYDVTEISRLNRKTGIQRVTWEIFKALTDLTSLTTWTLVPVIGNASSKHFYNAEVDLEAESFAAAHNTSAISPSSADVFLSVDLHYKIEPELVSVLGGYRSSGCSIFFIVHDILPITHPELFSVNEKWFDNEDFLSQFQYWLSAAAGLSNALISNSRTTQLCVEAWLKAQSIAEYRNPRLAHFRLGTHQPQRIDAPPTTQVAGIFDSSTTFLMVGTIEPRKGHALALDAFDVLWNEGKKLKLVIIGKPGWRSEALLQRIKSRTHFGVNLFYLSSASDEELAYSYTKASALLSISEAEGFGLPNVEAASYGLHILARDIEVFREVCGEGAYYVPKDLDPLTLAEHLRFWVGLAGAGTAPSPSRVKLISWKDSALELLSSIDVKI